MVGISVEKGNVSNLKIDIDKNFEKFPMTLSQSFSNSNNYAKLINRKIAMSGYPFIINTNQGKNVDYIVDFPIYWSPTKPYAILNEELGAVESLMIFEFVMIILINL